MELNYNLYEYTDIITVTYKMNKCSWSLIYDKNKDICMLLKNKKPAIINELSFNESEAYKEALDIAITYHHDRDGETTH